MQIIISSMDINEDVIQPLLRFRKDAVNFLQKCEKPDRKGELYILSFRLSYPLSVSLLSLTLSSPLSYSLSYPLSVSLLSLTLSSSLSLSLSVPYLTFFSYPHLFSYPLLSISLIRVH